MKLSTVIPAYNVEQYIGRCLDSIFNQQIDTDLLEVIVVNDGSKDGTENIIKQYASQHPNLIYISQENQGQSVARNNGFKKATGDLVWYVDSDDATTENSIQTIFSYFEKYPHADFLTFDRIHYNLADGTKSYCKSWGGRKAPHNAYETQFDGREANKYLVASVPWFHVFKKDFLIQNHLYFTPNLLNEDDELRMRLFFFAQEVRYIPFAHYIYSAMRPGSLTTENHSFTIKTAYSCIGTISAWKQFEKEYAKSKKDKQYILNNICSEYSELLTMPYKENTDLKEIYIKEHKRWKKDYFRTYLQAVSLSVFSFIDFIKFIIILLCPQYFKYTKIASFKKLISR